MLELCLHSPNTPSLRDASLSTGTNYLYLLIIFGEVNKLWSSSFCSLLLLPLTFSLLGPNILISSLFSDSLNLRYPRWISFGLRWTNQHVSEPRLTPAYWQKNMCPWLQSGLILLNIVYYYDQWQLIQSEWPGFSSRQGLSFLFATESPMRVQFSAGAKRSIRECDYHLDLRPSSGALPPRPICIYIPKLRYKGEYWGLSPSRVLRNVSIIHCS